MKKSALQIARAAYQPKLPKALLGPVKAVEGAATQSVGNQDEIKALFPNTYGMPVITFEAGEAKELPAFNVGVILSGGQAPGGHNVISGLFDGVKSLNPANKLYGFILGPGGLVDHKYMEITSELMDEYRNTGGFDIIGSGRTKLEKEDQFEKGIEILRELGIKALVIIGGDDSNTNACVLAEYYAAKKYGVQVIGCPKTIDGDLKNEQIETSFGFDTACKTYSELIGNIERDCNSARKYWHFIKLMGRSASHIALECALQTQPNICLISEEVEAKEMSLDDVVTYIATAVANRAAEGNNFGVAIIPEGVVEFVPEFSTLIAEINELLAGNKTEEFKNIEQYNNLPEDSHVEVFDGVSYDMASPSEVHQTISMELSTTINNYIRNKKGGCRIFHAPFDVVLSEAPLTVVQPDLMVVCDRDKLDGRRCNGAPDFVIEIVSPGNPADDYIRKLYYYKNAGVKEYWIVDPRRNTVTVNYFEKNLLNIQYSFDAVIKVNIYDDLYIDFAEISSRLSD